MPSILQISLRVVLHRGKWCPSGCGVSKMFEPLNRMTIRALSAGAVEADENGKTLKFES